MSQFPSHRPSVTDDLRTGNAVAPDSTKKGIPLSGAEAQPILVYSLGAPAAAAANAISLSQTLLSATDAVLNGTLASGSPAVATLDVPRAVSVTSSNAGDTTQTATVYGTDVYGQSMREVLSFNGAATINGKKAFKRVTRVAISAALAGNLTIGTTTILGLPYRPVVGGFLRGRLNEDTADAGTYVAPIRTTSTSTSADTRGTYTPAGALNGSNVYTVALAVQNGPNNSDAFGIAQYNG